MNSVPTFECEMSWEKFDSDGEEEWQEMPEVDAELQRLSLNWNKTDKRDDTVFEIPQESVSPRILPRSSLENEIHTVAPPINYERYITLKKTAYALEIAVVILWIFAIVSTALSQWGLAGGIVVMPIGFAGFWTFKRVVVLIFLVGLILDVLAFFVYSVVTSMVGGSLGWFVTLVQFLVILSKMAMIFYTYRFWVKLPQNPSFFERFKSAPNDNLNDVILDSHTT